MKKLIIIIKISIIPLIGQNIYFVNDLIEKNGTFYNYMNDDLLSGYLYYSYVDEEKSAKKLFVGKIKDGIKSGFWTRYWYNGNKKKKVCIKILLKMDFGLNGLRMEINT